MSKAREFHLVVAVLIATAIFTLLGGYKSDQGTAILAKKAAFIAFFISYAIQTYYHLIIKTLIPYKKNHFNPII